jgi:hypothetical protein
MKACLGEVDDGIRRRAADSSVASTLGRRIGAGAAEVAAYTALTEGIRIAIAEHELFGDRF